MTNYAKTANTNANTKTAGYVEEENSEITKLKERISELESELEDLQSQYDDLR